MSDFVQLFEAQKDDPTIQKLKRWIEEDLHKSIADIRDISTHGDLIDIGRSMYDPVPEHHQYPNLMPAITEVTIYFNGDDTPYRVE